MSQPERYISRLRLTSFRNYATAALDLDHRHVILTGANGAGKTNLLEAISLLSPGRGLRRAPFETLVQSGGAGSWAVAATIETPLGPIDLGTANLPDGSGRRARINGNNASAIEELGTHVRLLWLTPAMDGLFTGGASPRRRFLDRLVMTLVPDHAVSVAGFEKSMRQRNKLLEGGKDAAWMTAVEAQMATFAAAIYFARADTLAHLQVLVVSDPDGPFPAASLALSPLFSDHENFVSSSQLEQELMEHWKNARGEDRKAHRTLVGPHRIDLMVTHVQKSMPASLCSTGEQKGLLIGLVLAHARLVAQMTAMTPLLLLDEITAHLDPERRQALFLALDQLNTQVWLTGTDPILFQDMVAPARHISVDEGRLSFLN